VVRNINHGGDWVVYTLIVLLAFFMSAIGAFIAYGVKCPDVKDKPETIASAAREVRQ
jgi:Na+-transporting methylmalonyl-CoA/oxaloacetate decarboxylase gamma subunit